MKRYKLNGYDITCLMETYAERKNKDVTMAEILDKYMAIVYPERTIPVRYYFGMIKYYLGVVVRFFYRGK